MIGEGFATPDSASPVTDIHKVRYNLLKEDHSSALRLNMLSFKMTTPVCFLSFLRYGDKVLFDACSMRIKLNKTLYFETWCNMCEIASTYTV